MTSLLLIPTIQIQLPPQLSQLSSPQVQKLARDLCQSSNGASSEGPVHVHIGEGNIGELKANNRITQNVEMIDSYSIRGNQFGASDRDVDSYKVDRIGQVVTQEMQKKCPTGNEEFKTIIFCMTKKGKSMRRWKDE